jgi:hypothetical protein
VVLSERSTGFVETQTTEARRVTVTRLIPPDSSKIHRIISTVSLHLIAPLTQLVSHTQSRRYGSVGMDSDFRLLYPRPAIVFSIQ